VLVELDEGRATRLQNGESASLFEFLKVRPTHSFIGGAGTTQLVCLWARLYLSLRSPVIKKIYDLCMVPACADEPPGHLHPGSTLGRQRHSFWRRRHVPGHAHGRPRARCKDLCAQLCTLQHFRQCTYGYLPAPGADAAVHSRVDCFAGGEFKAAIEEARVVRAHIVFGDRPVDVTSERIAASVGIQAGRCSCI